MNGKWSPCTGVFLTAREVESSGIDQAVEDAAGGGIEGEGHLVGGDGVGDVEGSGDKGLGDGPRKK